MCPALKHEYDFVRLLCFSAYFFWGPRVHLDEPGVPRIDVSGSKFEVIAPIPEEECEKRKKKKNALKSPLTAVLES